MRRALCFLILALLANHARTVPAKSQTIPERPTETEVREAHKVAAAFMKRIEQTRDIAALKDLYVDGFLKRKMATGGGSLHDFGSSLSYRTDLMTEAAPLEWERFYAAQVNLRYFMVLYFIANTHRFLTHEPTLSELYPPEIIALLKANPFLAEGVPDVKYKIETLEELRGVIATLERATTLMRERFGKHPPEQTGLYQANMRAWAAKEAERNYMSPDVYIHTGGYFGFPEGTRFFRLRTVPQLFDLTLVRTDEGMKLVWASVYLFN